MPVTLDDKLLAQHHAVELLKALRDVAEAYSQHQRAPRGRKREDAMTGIFIQASKAAALLSSLNLK